MEKQGEALANLILAGKLVAAAERQRERES